MFFREKRIFQPEYVHLFPQLNINFLHPKIISPNKSITHVTVLNQLTKPITTTSHQIIFLLGGITIEYVYRE